MNTSSAHPDTLEALTSAGYSGAAPLVVDHEDETIVFMPRASTELYNLHWPKENMPIEYKIQAGGPSFAKSEIIAGINVWVDEPCSFVTAKYAGVTPGGWQGARVSSGDGVNGVYWESDRGEFKNNPSRLGMTWRTFDPKTWEVQEFDIILNSSQNWSGTPMEGYYDLQTLVAHEFGHALGFKHVSDAKNIMNTSLASGTRVGIGPLDLEQLHKNYKSKACGGTGGPANPLPTPTPNPTETPVPVRYCAGQRVTVDLALGQRPTGGNDVILGTERSEVIDTRSGNDIVCGGGGNDTIRASGSGNMTLYGDAGNDKLRYSGNGTAKLYGGDGNDQLNTRNSRGNNTLDGGSGNDVLWGGNGNDNLLGRSGNDRLFGNNGDDTLAGNWGDDSLFGGAGGDQMNGGLGSDRLFGGDGNDRIEGFSGNDRLFGGSGDDRLDGGSGVDRCDGKSGNDKASACETVSNAVASN